MFLLVLILGAFVTANAHLRVCYYSNWSQYRQGSAKFLPEDIDPFLCTHLIYSFANLVNNQLARFEDNDVDLYGRFNNLKAQNPNLKTLLAVGGWTAGSAPFSTLAASSTLRKNFATASAAYLRTYGFDGLDLDWEYPALRGGAAADKANFVLLLKDLKEEFAREKDVSGLPQLLLTAAVAAGKDNVDTAYDIPGMNKYLDFINLMAYDLHGGWESSTGHNAPLYSRSSEQGWQAYLNVDWAARYWVEKGTPANKLIIGLATYGRTFTLANPSSNGMGAPAVGSGGNAGPFTQTQGFLAYYEVCLKLSRNEGTRMWDDEHAVPYLVDGNQWIGYDDEESITHKLEYIRDNGFGGAMVWNIDLDDFQGICPLSTRDYTLMSLMKEVLDDSPSPSDSPTDQPTGNPPTDGPTDTPTNSPTNEPTDAPTNGPINPPTNGPTDTAHLRVCYYSNWSQYRQGSAKFLPEDIDPFLCTHLIYSFANLVNNQLARFEDNDVDLYGRFNNLKAQNPNLKTLLAVGGWTAGSAPFSTLAASSTLRKNFATASAAYLRTYGFDGLDMDWEYPALRGGAAADKANFVLLLKDLKEEFAREKAVSGLPQLLLTAAVAAGKGNVDTAYDIPGMNKYLDFINLMAYDLHGGWESSTGHNAPLYSRSSEQGWQAYLNVDWAARYWVEKGTPANKLIIGLATYGRTFTLANPSNNGMGAPAVGSGGNAGPFTQTQGFLAYYEVCLKLSRNEGTRMWDDEHEVPYLVDGNQWIGYDDEESITLKLEYIRDNGFGGAMVWNIDLDDFQGICPLSTRDYTLMSLMKEVLDGSPLPTNSPTDQPTGNPPTDRPTDNPTNSPTDEPTDAPTNGPTNPPTNGPTDTEFCSSRADGLYPDVFNCNMYYHCYARNAHHKSCPPDLVFNPRYSYCDFPYNYDCQAVTTPNPGTTTKESTQPPTTQPPTTEPPTIEPPTTGAPTTQPPTTQPPTTQPPTTQPPTTEPPTTEAPTTQPPTTQPPTTQPPTTQPPTTEPPNTEAPTIQPPTTQPPTTQPPTTQPPTTEPPTTQPPTTQSPTTQEPWQPDLDFCADRANGLYKIVEDCSKYYHCAHGKTFVSSCLAGTLYSASMKNCDWAANVDCSDMGPTTEFCQDMPDGLYWYPDDCKKYYECGSGITYIKSCSPGTLYDSSVKNCGWRGMVDCKGAPDN